MAPVYSVVQPTEGGAGMILTGTIVKMLGYIIGFIVLAVILSLSTRGADHTHTHLYLPTARVGLTHAVGATSRAKCPRCRAEKVKLMVENL
ncbi:hypothetical protein C8Q76DRAFT_802969 [Earliella scabrosa]|nr:hypothetical protein C8Q76DRAFT_802969 [Earliella scabrosa]